ncbi:MAG: hypothetical protein L3J67_07690 [Hyphomicrobiaceae bacterium]|nr:hypothetical protein [Hyphomicrobiaceae bacterium]
MVSPFAKAVADMNVHLDEHMGEMIRITPMVEGDFDVSPDPARPAFEVKALVVEVDPSNTPIPSLKMQVEYEEIAVEIRRALLPAGFSLRKGYEVELLEHPENMRFIITAPPERLDAERIVIKIGPSGDIYA